MNTTAHCEHARISGLYPRQPLHMLGFEVAADKVVVVVVAWAAELTLAAMPRLRKRARVRAWAQRRTGAQSDLLSHTHRQAWACCFVPCDHHPKVPRGRK
eukprot:297223-Pleurochrysis_carterae.AAC.6